MSRQNLSNPEEFLKKAIGIYKKMMKRRWNAAFLGMDVRSEPDIFKQLKNQANENIESKRRYEQITIAIKKAKEENHKKLQLILEVAQIPFALESKVVTAQNAIDELNDLSMTILQAMQTETEESEQIRKTEISSGMWTSFQYYINQAMLSVSSWTSSLSNDWQFSMDVHALLIEVSKYAQKILIQQYDETKNINDMLDQTTQVMESHTCTLLNELHNRGELMEQLQNTLQENEKSLKAAEEEKEHLKELLSEKGKLQEETKEKQNEVDEILYHYTREDMKLISSEIVLRLEEYRKADYIFADLLKHVKNIESSINKDDFAWVELMYERFSSVYRLIFDGIDENLVKDTIEQSFPDEYLDVMEQQARTKISEFYNTFDFLDRAKSLSSEQDAKIKAFREQATYKSEAKKVLASFSEELMKRLHNLKSGNILRYAQLAGDFAKRNEGAMIKYIENEIEKEKHQRKRQGKNLEETEADENTNESLTLTI